MKRCIKVGKAMFAVLSALPLLQTSDQVRILDEAPAGFDNLTNGFLSQNKRLLWSQAEYCRRRLIGRGVLFLTVIAGECMWVLKVLHFLSHHLYGK
jgi:hypothetical protein